MINLRLTGKNRGIFGKTDKYLRLNEVSHQLACPRGNLGIRATKIHQHFPKLIRFLRLKLNPKWYILLMMIDDD